MVAATPDAKQFGEIRPDSLYRATEACKRLGWSGTAYRTARRKGLVVKYFANRAYVTGQALVDFLLANGKDTR
jgi:hypothetical protein